MPVTPTPIFAQTINNSVLVFNNSGTSITTLYTAGANGSRIESIFVTNTDTAAYTVNVYITQSSTNYLIGTASIPLSSGNTTAVPTVDLLGAAGNFGTVLNFDANGNTYLFLSSNSILKVATTATVTSGKNLTFVAFGGDY